MEAGLRDHHTVTGCTRLCYSVRVLTVSLLLSVQCCAVAVHLQHHHHPRSVLGHPESEGDTVLYRSAVPVTVSHYLVRYYSVLHDLEMRGDYVMRLADNRERLLAGNRLANTGHHEGC